MQKPDFWHHARMSSHDLIQHLQARLQKLPAGEVAVGYSGGMDSTVLLHALAEIPAARERGLRAIHVDHGLHADSRHWSQHCERLARDLDVPIRIVRVDVQTNAGTGLEAAARQARMSAFAEHLKLEETIALAQHGDDQAETVLLKLLRGAGPEGLGGMRERRRLDRGWLWRPLLALPRSTLQKYARSQALRWIDDPSNMDTDLRRNFLRLEILPRLRKYWPQAQAALGHSATWARSAADFISAQAIRALDQIRGDSVDTLRWQAWLELPDALRDPVLRLWLRSLGLDEPGHQHLRELERQLADAASDRMPCLRLATTEIRRYREQIYAMRALAPVPADWQADWNGAPLRLPTGDWLQMQPQPATWPDAPTCRVRFRRGGERFKPATSRHSRELRIVLQEQAVPPWQRERLPLIWFGNELIAVGDLLLSDNGQALCKQLQTHLFWQRSTRD